MLNEDGKTLTGIKIVNKCGCTGTVKHISCYTGRKPYKEFNTLCGETGPVRLGDLIEELARLRCIDDTYIRVNIKPIISFDGLHYIDEITKLINTVYYDFTATLEITLACSWCTKDCAGITSISRIFSYLIRTNSKL